MYELDIEMHTFRMQKGAMSNFGANLPSNGITFYHFKLLNIIEIQYFIIIYNVSMLHGNKINFIDFTSFLLSI